MRSVGERRTGTVARERSVGEEGRASRVPKALMRPGLRDRPRKAVQG
jgi:hypothetical protein